MNWSSILEHNAANNPEKVAIIFEDQRITFAEMAKRVNALAKSLLDLGVTKGDVVAILLYNHPEFLELTYAVNKIGAIWLPMNFRLAGEELAYIINHSNAKVLVSEEDFFSTVAGVKNKLPNLKDFIAVGKTSTGWRSYDDLISWSYGAKVPDADVDLNDIERLMYTSGTTAYPKGVMLTYGNLFWKNMAQIILFKFTPADICLVVGPLYHVGGMDIGATSVMHASGTIAMTRKFTTLQTLEMIQKEKVTQVWLAPAMVNMLLQEPKLGNYDVSSLRVICDGGEKMPLPLIKELAVRFPNAWFANGYGLTESVSGDTFLEQDKIYDKLGSVGKPVPMIEVKIVDDDGKELSANTLGEIILRGPKIFKGYWRDPEATAKAIKNGWFYTGDLGHLDKYGYLYIEDRKKDMIKSGGENVSSTEVERIIYELKQVSEVAVVGIPHPKWLEVPKAFVVLKEGCQLTPDEIINHCTGKLAKFKVPKEIEFIGALPRNPSGKVLKRELRQR